MKNKSFLLLCLVLALALRLYKIVLIKCIANDGIAYIGVAKDIINGKGFNAIWPPLYPWFISLLMRIGINPELSGQLVSVIFGVLTVAMVYLLTKSLFPQVIVRISTLFCVFHPYLVRYSAEVLTDSLFTFLITFCVFCGWNALKKKNLFWVIFTGLLAGLAYLTKPEGIFLLVIISVWWLFTDYKRLGFVICAWIIFFTVSFPYLNGIKKETNRWMLSQKETVVFSKELQKEGLTCDFLNISPLEYAKENPKKFAVKLGSGLLKLLGRFPDAYHPLLFLFLIIGLIGGIKEKKYLFYIFSFMITFFIGYSIFHPGRRYLVGWVPVTLFLAGYGLEKISKFTKGIWIPIVITIFIMLPKTLGQERADSAKWKEAGLWIKNNSKGEVRVMCEDNRTAFYAGGEYVSWAKDNFNKADYIVTADIINSLEKTYTTTSELNIYYGKI